MKYLAYFLVLCSAAGAEVNTHLINDGASVPPATALVAEFYNRGNDIVSVVANGVTVGQIYYPYRVNYTSKPLGQVNTFVVTTCDYLGRTATLNFTTVSQGRTFSKRRH